MSFRRDVRATFRASYSGGGSNWRAHHASAAMVFCPIFAAAAIYFFLADNGFQRSLWFLAFSALCFIYWRYLLPEAIRHTEINRTLYGDDQNRAQLFAKKP